jgi:hypothetical protein
MIKGHEGTRRDHGVLEAVELAIGGRAQGRFVGREDPYVRPFNDQAIAESISLPDAVLVDIPFQFLPERFIERISIPSESNLRGLPETLPIFPEKLKQFFPGALLSEILDAADEEVRPF